MSRSGNHYTIMYEELKAFMWASLEKKIVFATSMGLKVIRINVCVGSKTIELTVKCIWKISKEAMYGSVSH